MRIDNHEQLRDDGVLATLVGGGADSQPNRLRLRNATIEIDGRPLPQPNQITERIAYGEVAVEVAQLLHQKAVDRFWAKSDSNAVQIVVDARRELNCARDLLRQLQAARDEFVTGLLERADIDAHEAVSA